MPLRNAHHVGDYLMLDDSSGFIHYRSEMVELWNGNWVHRKQFEARHPQEFVTARVDPKALRHVYPEEACADVTNSASSTVGDSGVPATANGPGTRLF